MQDRSRYGHVYATFEASAQLIESSKEETAKDALDLLSIMSVMNYNTLPLSLFQAAWRGAHRVAAAGAEENRGIDHLSSWHIAQLVPFIQSGSEAWDLFRVVEACHLLNSLSLISTEKDSNETMIVMHPLAYTWARVR